MQTQENLAKTLGVTPGTISKAKKKLGILTETMTEDQQSAVMRYLQGTKLIMGNGLEDIQQSNDFKADVRRIDTSEGSSLIAMLQDAKEQYVKNEEMIQRLLFEMENQTSLIHMNGNRTISAVPHFKPLESLQKVNISLRNQILSLENELGKVPSVEKDADPFE